jgi:hypothetical protein
MHFFASTVGICQADRAKNLSCVGTTSTGDGSRPQTLDILELAAPATLAQLLGYTYNNPPIAIRTIASIDFPGSGSLCSVALPGASTYELDLASVVFFGIRVRNYLIPDVLTPGNSIDRDIRINLALD